jgi:hypothetical protein
MIFSLLSAQYRRSLYRKAYLARDNEIPWEEVRQGFSQIFDYTENLAISRML